MKSCRPSVFAAALLLSLLSGEALARAGRCNVTIRPNAVQGAQDEIARRETERCTAALPATPPPTEAQRQACRDQAKAKGERFKRDIVDADRRLVNPENRNENDRGNPRPRGHAQTMSRCGGGEGQGPGERQPLRQMRQLIQSGEMNSGMIACFCRNDTQAAQRAATEEAERRRLALQVPERPALAPELTPPPRPAAVWFKPWTWRWPWSR